MNEPESKSDWEDRLVDLALEESVGGQAPPDLSEKILEASRRASVTTLQTGEQAMNDTQHATISKRKHWTMLAVAASLMVAVGIFAFTDPVGINHARMAARTSPDQKKESSESSLERSRRSEMSRRESPRELEEESDTLQTVTDGKIIAELESAPGLDGAKNQQSAEDRSADTFRTLAKSLPEADFPALATPDSRKNLNASSSTKLGVEVKNVEGMVIDHSGPESGVAGGGGGLGGRTAGQASNSELALGRARIKALDPDHLLRYSQSEPTAAPSTNANDQQTVQRQINEKKQELVDLELTRQLAVQQANSPTATEAAIQNQLDKDPRYRDFQREEYAYTQQLTQLKAVTRGRKSPELERLKDQVKTLQTQIQEYRTSKELELRKRLKSAPNDMLQSRMMEYMLRKQQIDSDIADLEKLRRLKRRLDDQQGRGPGTSGDQYARIYENPFVKTKTTEENFSTFSIDVDTASYANVRQFLMQSHQLPPPDAVRLEELVNYFDYDYTAPTGDVPFASHVEVAGCPWNADHRLVRIGIKGREIQRHQRPQSNLVFLIDVSGSMNEPTKLPLLVEGMKLLTRELGENDKVAIVVYASSEGLALASTRGDREQQILAALDKLRAGGSTAGGAGIELAYKTAAENYIEGGVNRVILCTDGDFNVGVTSEAALEQLAEERAKNTGVFLTVLGFGRGNLNDSMMEKVSGKGNGNYHYVDNLTEARKVLVEEMAGTLVTIAKDVKIQIDFNPHQVAGYRLLGYENRMLRTEDFNNDKKDAGEIGAGHTVTALYEIIPAGKRVDVSSVDASKYVKPVERLVDENHSNEILTLRIRYKQPDADTSTKQEFPITDEGGSFAEATPDFQFASAVASFGMLLRDSEHKGNTSYAAVKEIAQGASERDTHGYRAEFLQLVERARQLAGE